MRQMERDLGTKLGTGSPSTISIPAILTPTASSAVAASVGRSWWWRATIAATVPLMRLSH